LPKAILMAAKPQGQGGLAVRAGKRPRRDAPAGESFVKLLFEKLKLATRPGPLGALFGKQIRVPVPGTVGQGASPLKAKKAADGAGARKAADGRSLAQKARRAGGSKARETSGLAGWETAQPFTGPVSLRRENTQQAIGAMKAEGESESGAALRALASKPASSPKLVLIDLRASVKAEDQDPAAGREQRNNALKTASPRKAEQEGGELALVLRARSETAAKPEAQAAQRQGGPDLQRAFLERTIPEVVQRTQIILREGGEGEIRLVLKPESLGSVRVRLQIGDSHLEGRIIVENNSVKELFESGLDQLKTALKGEGFQTANLEVTVGQGNTNGQSPQGELPGGWAREARHEFERALPLLPELGAEDRLVNLVV